MPFGKPRNTEVMMTTNPEVSADQQELEQRSFRGLSLLDGHMTLQQKLDTNNLLCSLRSISKPLRRKVKVGQLVKVVGGGTETSGTITQVNDGYCKVYTVSEPSDPIDRIEWRSWWSFPIGFVYLTDDSVLMESTGSTANFKGVTDVPNRNTLHVKWSLFYGDTEFLKGVDWQKPGYCEAALSGYKFKEGTYTFKARRLNRGLTKTVSENEVSFELKKPTEAVSIGTINSIYVPLKL